MKQRKEKEKRKAMVTSSKLLWHLQNLRGSVCTAKVFVFYPSLSHVFHKVCCLKNIAEHTFATLQLLVYQLVARCVKSLKKNTCFALIQLGEDGVALSAIPVAFVHGFINQKLGVVQGVEFSMRILAGYNVEEVLFWVPFRVLEKKQTVAGQCVYIMASAKKCACQDLLQ